LIRSALLLLACLPVLVLWRGSLRRLWLVLGWGLFVLVGFAAMIQAYWLPLGP
jgi:hypothetical protein